MTFISRTKKGCNVPYGIKNEGEETMKRWLDDID